MQVFQSTLPVGGATRGCSGAFRKVEFQSTLPVGGATAKLPPEASARENFNPRSPWGERRYDDLYPDDVAIISIHAPRGGSDLEISKSLPSAPDFNPRSPWGERPPRTGSISKWQLFQSTLPVGGATRLSYRHWPHTTISIHAPRGGSDLLIFSTFDTQNYFNPRSPWGERPIHHLSACNR